MKGDFGELPPAVSETLTTTYAPSSSLYSKVAVRQQAKSVPGFDRFPVCGRIEDGVALAAGHVDGIDAEDERFLRRRSGQRTRRAKQACGERCREKKGCQLFHCGCSNLLCILHLPYRLCGAFKHTQRRPELCGRQAQAFRRLDLISVCIMKRTKYNRFAVLNSHRRNRIQPCAR